MLFLFSNFFRGSRFTVSLGGVELLNNNETLEVVLQGAQTIAHENYDPTTLNNDIALIKLPSAVALSEY
jgi:hypothetical protein